MTLSSFLLLSVPRAASRFNRTVAMKGLLVLYLVALAISITSTALNIASVAQVRWSVAPF